MFENKKEPLAKHHIFLKRLITYWISGLLILVISLGLGTMGYMHYGHLSIVDGFYNASMILTGMGPAEQNPLDPAKIFASFYAIYSGVIFLSSMTIIFAPIVHRFFHIIHLEDSESND
jgi:hypothetical protein